jgi:hypothetical protein
VTDKNDFLETQVNHKGGDVAAEMLDRAFLRPAGGLAVRPQVTGNDFMILL